MKQLRLTDQLTGDSSPPPVQPQPQSGGERPSTRFMDIDLEDLKKHPLWSILVETAHRNPLFPGVCSYARSNIIPKRPDITPRELASTLSISLGEALVLLDEIRQS